MSFLIKANAQYVKGYYAGKLVYHRTVFATDQQLGLVHEAIVAVQNAYAANTPKLVDQFKVTGTVPEMCLGLLDAAPENVVCIPQQDPILTQDEKEFFKQEVANG
jgi:hypothetical protein